MTAPIPPAPADPFAGVDFSDNRGGVFFLVDGARVHDSDLTDAQRATIATEDAARSAETAPKPAPANLPPADVNPSNA